jgi:hypothetical protein
LVDHIDNDRGNNSRNNLQWISLRENNTKDRLNMSSKFAGVSRRKGLKIKKWEAYISLNKKRAHLGLFKTEVEASEAYKKALKNRGLENKYSKRAA